MGEECEKQKGKEEEKKGRICPEPCTAYNPNMYIFLMWSRR